MYTLVLSERLFCLEVTAAGEQAPERKQSKQIKEGLAAAARFLPGEGYQVPRSSVFKCEMSGKVIGHVVGVSAGQRRTDGADLGVVVVGGGEGGEL